jgi:hypothetical protein
VRFARVARPNRKQHNPESRTSEGSRFMYVNDHPPGGRLHLAHVPGQARSHPGRHAHVPDRRQPGLQDSKTSKSWTTATSTTK